MCNIVTPISEIVYAEEDVAGTRIYPLGRSPEAHVMTELIP